MIGSKGLMRVARPVINQ